jgi:hypothetical protein
MLLRATRRLRRQAPHLGEGLQVSLADPQVGPVGRSRPLVGCKGNYSSSGRPLNVRICALSGSGRTFEPDLVLGDMSRVVVEAKR